MLLQKNFNFQQITDILERQLVSTDDSLVHFIKALLLDCDFEKCQSIIRAIQKDLKNDFFLHHLEAQIVENAQHLFFYVYFKLQKRVKIQTVATLLGLSHEEAEILIVNFISQFNIKAKIDSV